LQDGDAIIVAELSRLGRSIQSMIIALAFSMAAEIERVQSSQRTKEGLINRCGLAMLHKLAGVNPVQVIASHEPGIEPCRHVGNDVLDA